MCEKIEILPTSHGSPADSAGIVDKISALLERWAKALNASAVQEMAAMVTEDAAFWTHGAAELAGREAVTAAFGPVLVQYNLEQGFRFVELLVSGDLAFMRGVEHNRITPKSGGLPMERVQRAFSILRRDPDGEWRFARGMTNLPPAE